MKLFQLRFRQSKPCTMNMEQALRLKTFQIFYKDISSALKRHTNKRTYSQTHTHTHTFIQLTYSLAHQNVGR